MKYYQIVSTSKKDSHIKFLEVIDSSKIKNFVEDKDFIYEINEITKDEYESKLRMILSNAY